MSSQQQPRKFSDRIAMLKKREQQQLENFNQVMRDVEATTKPKVSVSECVCEWEA